MKDRLKALGRPENILLVPAFAISFGLLIFDIIQPVPDILPKATLSVLGILAFGMLTERLGYFERFEQVLREIKQAEKPFLQIPVDWMPFEKYAKDAQEISVSGGTLAQLVPRYRDFFEQKARSGCKLRFILVNPDSAAIEAIARWAAAPPDRAKKEIGVSLSHLKQLKKTGCDIEVRLNNSIPALTVMIFDASQTHGRIRVDLQLYQCSPARRPYFELTHAPFDEQEEDLFQNFLCQFETLWSQSEPWNGDFA